MILKVTVRPGVFLNIEQTAVLINFYYIFTRFSLLYLIFTKLLSRNIAGHEVRDQGSGRYSRFCLYWRGKC